MVNQRATFRLAPCLAGLVLCTAALPTRQAQTPQPGIVTIQGVASTYSSCSLVKFSLHNVSSRDVYVNVYVENLNAAEWTHVPCQYDLNDPRSRTAKLLFSDRNLLRAGVSLDVSYDRCADYAYCMTPRYGKYDIRRARATLQREDARATSAVTQRIWVDAYRRDQPPTKPGDGPTAPDAVVFSQPFTRVSR